MTSSVFKVDDLIASFATGTFVAPRFSKFMDALIRGDYEAFKSGDTPEIFPVFQIDSEIQQSPLIYVRVLSLLDTARKSATAIENKHLSVSSITNYFDSIGATEASIDRALTKLLESKLVEPYDASEKDLSPAQRLAISHRGTAHLRLASKNSVYFYQMALTTGITNDETATQILQVYNSNISFFQKTKNIRQMFLDYIVLEDVKYISQNTTGDQFENQRLLFTDLANFSTNINQEQSDASEVLGEEYKLGFIKKKVNGNLEFFDIKKGFGFVEIQGMSDDAYLPGETIAKTPLEKPNQGDKIICDIMRMEKGWAVIEIHKVTPVQSSLEEVEAEVIRIHKDRPYGFIKIIGSDRDALFHFSAIPGASRENIKLGTKLQARIYQDTSGRGWRVKDFPEIQ